MLTKCELSQQISTEVLNINLHKNHFSEYWFAACRKMDRHDEANSRI